MMRGLDLLVEGYARTTANKLSRRSLVAKLGTLLVAGASLPLLPIARAFAEEEHVDSDSRNPTESGDPRSCEYWRYCAIDGFLSACCGGTMTSCPPGTEPSIITWIGTCMNPVDGRHYIISYNDCCGKSSCGRCECFRNEGDLPMYSPAKNNDINWCIGTKSKMYNSTLAVVLGEKSLHQG